MENNDKAGSIPSSEGWPNELLEDMPKLIIIDEVRHLQAVRGSLLIEVRADRPRFVPWCIEGIPGEGGTRLVTYFLPPPEVSNTLKDDDCFVIHIGKRKPEFSYREWIMRLDAISGEGSTGKVDVSDEQPEDI